MLFKKYNQLLVKMVGTVQLPDKKGKFVLLLLTGTKYEKYMPSFLGHFLETHKKICFVSSAMTWDMLKDMFKKSGLDISRIIFVDTLSSYYGDKVDTKNCLFVKNPYDFDLLKTTIQHAIIESGCKGILFDSVSDFWSQKYTMDLYKLMNSLVTEKHFSDKTKWLCLVKQVAPGDYHERTKDFAMLANKVLHLNSER
jgi:hypothetical protein